MSKDEVAIHILRKVVLDGFLLGGMIVALVAIDLLLEPYHRGFFCGDQSIMYPYKDDTVTVPLMRTIGIGLPALAIIICEFVHLRKEKNPHRVFRVPLPTFVRSIYCVGITFAIGACFNEIASEISKNTIGRLRPHFFNLCKPSVNCSSMEWQNRYIQSDEFTCTGSRVDLFTNMRKSFVSGHSAWASYTMVFFALYLQKRMNWQGTRFLRHSLQFTGLMLSWYTALSRISDNKHHWSDVLAGYCLGTTVAVLMWFCCTDLIKPKEQIPVPTFENGNRNQIAMT